MGAETKASNGKVACCFCLFCSTLGLRANINNDEQAKRKLSKRAPLDSPAANAATELKWLQRATLGS